ncbi:MAG TPA: ketoacyl-ACP synthase III [Bacteroidia bacterium]|nr:ketoacyl-ACP synthase III [Bacteroidia bacterium]HRS59095.1 ketoacyl-ACP synthase III [Bacteroidia bacterium]HRU68455.1 ketoacyl-ACP synthase III [Bacteroidia bacterium]
MAIFTTYHTAIRGISCAVPKNCFDVKNYKWVSEKEREQLIKTTGVRFKRIAPSGMATSDLAYDAANLLVSRLGWEMHDIDILIFISQSRDYLIPATACILQDRLGMPKTTLALDISLGCSAYVYGLSVISSMMSAGKLKKGLLIMGDTSTFGSYRDKTTFPLFGDAASVTALEYDETASPMHFNLQTDGSGYEAIIVYAGGARKFPNKKSLEQRQISKGVWRNELQPHLDGIKVFNFSLREVIPNIRALLDFTQTDIQSVDYFVLHQANLLINETLRKMLRQPAEKWPYSITKYGNTSSASIPLTIVSELRERAMQPMRLMLTGFGVGLSWGSVLVDTRQIVIPEIIEKE